MTLLADASSHAAPVDRTPHRPFWPWFGALCALLLTLAALRPLAVPDEGRYAEVGRWMMMSGDWVTPRLNGIPFLHKPPLLHWLEASVQGVFGPSPWSARLVPALHAALMLAGLYVAARRFASPAFARRAALMLGASGAFLLGGQYVNHDTMVAAWIATAIWCFALAFMHGARPHAGWARAGFVACALGVLSKGLIGLVLPGAVLFVWLSWTRQWRKVPGLPWLSGLALFAAIAVPWFVLIERRQPGALQYLFGVHQFGRYTGTTFNNPQPVWFYVAALPLLLFPWAFFALNRGWVPDQSRSNASQTIAKPWLDLCWIWLAVILLFFSIPRSKLVGYILPVLPPLAVLAAAGWERTWAGRRHAERWFGGLLVLALTVPVTISLVIGRAQDYKLSGDVAAALACAARPTDTIWVAGSYPYDLPFLIQSPRQIMVAQDWPRLRATAGDSWRRELFEGADFDAASAVALQREEALATASAQPGQWLVLNNRTKPSEYPPNWPQQWQLVQRGSGWSVYRSAPERPPAAEHEGLPGCHHHAGQQRRP